MRGDGVGEGEGKLRVAFIVGGCLCSSLRRRIALRDCRATRGGTKTGGNRLDLLLGPRALRLEIADDLLDAEHASLAAVGRHVSGCGLRAA